jgi:hypothetical protein
MFTREDLQKLFARPDRTMNAVFTLYLIVASGDYRQKLQRMLEEQKTGIYDHFETVHLLAAVQEVEQFFATYQPRGQSLVFVFDRIDRFFWACDLFSPGGLLVLGKHEQLPAKSAGFRKVFATASHLPIHLTNGDL